MTGLVISLSENTKQCGEGLWAVWLKENRLTLFNEDSRGQKGTRQEKKNNERENGNQSESLRIDHELTDSRSSSEQAVVINVCGDNDGTR